MNKLTPAMVTALAASTLAATGLAASPTAAAAVMPLSSQWRACDGTKLPWASAVGDARATAQVNASGPTIVANVDLATTLPDTHYDVRVIQIPRPSSGCAAGDPGVIVGSVQTDASGAGSTTFQGPVQSGATGAWIIVERPSDSSQTPAEFYTSEFAASV
jgi:hypothetical protein